MRCSRTRFSNVCLMSMIQACLGGVAHAEDEFINLPIVINIMNGSDMSEDDAREAVKAANEIYKQAGIKFTIHKINTGVADPSGDEGSSLTRADRDKLRENGVNELPVSKGVKVTFAAQPDAGDAGTNGLTVHKVPCSICRKTPRTGETMAHEIGHILTLDDLYGEGTEGRLMHGVFNTRTGTTLTDAEKEEIKKEAQKRACATVVKPTPESEAQIKQNGGGLSTNTGTLVPGVPSWQDILMGQWTLTQPDPFFEFRLTSAGIVPPSGSWGWDILLNTDGSPFTGNVLRGFPGIDARIFIQVSGPFIFGQLIRINPPQTAPVPTIRIIEPEYVTMLTEGPPRENPGLDVFEVTVPLSALSLGLDPVAHFVSGPNPSVNVDAITFNYERNQAGHYPYVLVLPPNVTPTSPPVFFYESEGFAPNSTIDITFNDVAAGSTSADEAGSASGIIFLPEVFGDETPETGYYFVTLQERTPAATFAYSVVHIDLGGGGGGCSPCIADYNGDGGIDGSDVEAFYNQWEGGEPCADVNQDGGIDGADVETFFAEWEGGNCG